MFNQPELNMPQTLTFDLSNMISDPADPNLIGGQIGLLFAATGGGQIGELQTLTTGETKIDFGTIPPVPPTTDPVPVDYFSDSFFDVFYRVEINPQSTITFVTICIWDP
jgi:hypothetical protein